MIEQFQFRITPPEGIRIPQSWAYRLYGWLMEQLPPSLGDALHQQGDHPIVQHLHFAKEEGAVIWTINLLNDTVRESVRPILEDLHTIQLHERTLRADLLRRKQEGSGLEILRSVRECDVRRVRLTFLSPCAFKQAGRYAIFPQENLILQSLTSHWNAVFPEMAVSDPDALQALSQGVHIVDYDLRTTRYALKETVIPGAVGSLILEAKLSPPLLELWNMLLAFAPYGGIGVKTTLGMGGVQVEMLRRSQQGSKRGSY